MMDDDDAGTDASSIKPVSSLRSRFETLGKDQSTPVSPALKTTRPPWSGGSKVSPATYARPTTPQNGDSTRSTTKVGENESGVKQPDRGVGGSARNRPASVISLDHPSRISPPMVTVESPRSPHKNETAGPRFNGSSASSQVPTHYGANGSPTRASSRPQSRNIIRAREDNDASTHPEDASQGWTRPRAPIIRAPESNPRSEARSMPPAVNRASKPKVPVKPVGLANTTTGLTAPTSLDWTDNSISPFSTPPSSGRNSPEKYDVFDPRQDPIPPTHHAIASRREQQAPPSTYRPVPTPKYAGLPGSASGDVDVPEQRPRLPVRPELQTRSNKGNPSVPRTGKKSPSRERALPPRRSADSLRAAYQDYDTATSTPSSAVKTSMSAATSQGFTRTPLPLVDVSREVTPRSTERRREPPPPPTTAQSSIPSRVNGHAQDELQDSSNSDFPTTTTINASDYPDASQANRRPPQYKQRPFQIPTDYDTRLFAVCGEYICTSGYITRAWTMRTGGLLLNLDHKEGVRVCSMIFKPTPNIDDEGKRLWLGTNIGEILEVDIPSQRVVKTQLGAHSRREIIRIFRYGSELWTLDDSGELNVWKPDHTGMPSLDSKHLSWRVPRGHSFSLACGEHLWLAIGKEIRVFLPRARSDAEFQVLRTPLVQPGTGDVTCGTLLSGKPDLVYFGHSDGRVSVYNRRTLSCVGVVIVSPYKISSLAGVGDFLWAGYSTGMTYVYDPSTTPWAVKKSWQAHEKQVCGIIADSTALWKMGRLNVITLGIDNMLRIWDGFLEDDWLAAQMHQHDTEYCHFNELKAAVLTWNAGAAKPHYLAANLDDNNFLREYITSRDNPDIFVFGFQELVDLEDKKLTAKTLFKSKKKDANDQEHMSHQYRAWRDHLTRSLDESSPSRFALLHTASMVGLFTCIFVKTSLKDRIRHVHSSEVKRGMGGRYGNKGALVLRLLLDDTSVCFANCHLAAGQTHTVSRNNDAAAILEASSLPAYPLSSSSPSASQALHSDIFLSGGDGAMILDHEICLLHGDLNYRIDTMSRDSVVRAVQTNDLPKLLARDQLLLSKKKNPAFRLRAFQENPITFAPTYKYNLRSDEYDTSEKRRAPAWCDRILFRGEGSVKVAEYRRWETPRVSDHRPVSAVVRLRVKKVDPERRKSVGKRVEGEFVKVRQKVARGVELEYLHSVLGLSLSEATAALRGSQH